MFLYLLISFLKSLLKPELFEQKYTLISKVVATVAKYKSEFELNVFKIFTSTSFNIQISTKLTLAFFTLSVLNLKEKQHKFIFLVMGATLRTPIKKIEEISLLSLFKH